MRILISILAIFVGIGLVCYSYVGSIVTLASEANEHARGGDEISAVSIIFDFIIRGEVPQLTGFFYTGAAVIAFAVVNLIVSRKKNDRKDSL